jgi:O-antigen ligase
MIKDAPVFGHGISGFRAEYLNYQADYFQLNPSSPYSILADDADTPFNEFLKILIEQGIAGLLLFFCILYCLFETTSLLRAKVSNKVGRSRSNPILQSLILCLLIFGLFSYPFDKLPFVVLFVFSIAFLSRNRHPVYTINLQKMRYLRISLLLAICFISGIFLWDACGYAK